MSAAQVVLAYLAWGAAIAAFALRKSGVELVQAAQLFPPRERRTYVAGILLGLCGFVALWPVVLPALVALRSRGEDEPPPPPAS